MIVKFPRSSTYGKAKGHNDGQPSCLEYAACTRVLARHTRVDVSGFNLRPRCRYGTSSRERSTCELDTRVVPLQWTSEWHGHAFFRLTAVTVGRGHHPSVDCDRGRFGPEEAVGQPTVTAARSVNRRLFNPLTKAPLATISTSHPHSFQAGSQPALLRNIGRTLVSIRRNIIVLVGCRRDTTDVIRVRKFPNDRSGTELPIRSGLTAVGRSQSWCRTAVAVVGRGLLPI
jgi:hypothetical protein